MPGPGCFPSSIWGLFPTWLLTAGVFIIPWAWGLNRSFRRFQHRWWDKRFCHEGSELFVCSGPTCSCEGVNTPGVSLVNLREVSSQMLVTCSALVWDHKVTILRQQTSSFLLFNKRSWLMLLICLLWQLWECKPLGKEGIFFVLYFFIFHPQQAQA